LKILVTNDDGIHSEGLWDLAKALKDVGDVTVVAPDRDQSGVGTAMTLLSVLRVQETRSPLEGVQAFSVEGTPADCVILGIEELMQGTIDLVVSGINQGSNLGRDVMVSGTVGAAFHGYFHDIPSMAVSVAYTNGIIYDVAAQTAGALARTISESPTSAPLLLNVNVPSLSADKIRSVELTKLGPTAYLGNVERGSNGHRTHYWINHNKPTNTSVPEGTDIWAIRDNRISITPLEISFDNGAASSSFDGLTGAVAAGLGIGAPR
jgi:5'-nucleotidase